MRRTGFGASRARDSHPEDILPATSNPQLADWVDHWTGVLRPDAVFDVQKLV